ncbi:MAG: SpoIID/LytB domain-containing protein [candidate division KSB1 bacterium]|nr:SpoIID/LytB domain-containing protein [candidate division KSB1 bacterium]MDZ7302893.1 SpoIID/LytB domain-containing protein [candidate division KSB1 bacterium]MDZ7310468.1 SpoIID/LytB domain-containing protein [candidate division KSB1 bacterium]
MIRKLTCQILLLGLLALIACLGPPAPDLGRVPIVRIGLMQNVDEIYFQTSEKLSLRDPARAGRLVAHNIEGQRWQVRIKQVEPARIEYRLLVIATRDKNEARAVLDSVVDAGLLPAMIEERPDYDRLWIAQNATTVYKVVLREKFTTRDTAIAKQKALAGKIQTELWERIKKPARGVLELKNQDNDKTYQLASGFQVIADQVALSNVAVGTGFHWEGSENRVYRGRMEFFIDRFSKLTVVNVLPIEDYIAGVVPSEMHPGFPLEALKAQAVAARNEIFSKVGTRHTEDGFDLCADVHCQVYSGINKETESTKQAVAATAGLVMKVQGVIIDANYAAVCGGHTENNENVWAGLSKPYLRGIFDGNARPDLLGNALKDENTLLRWVSTKPNVFCNTVQAEVPAALEYTKKYFRWEVNYTRSELQAMIRKRTGEDFGELQDLVPLERGPSGRLIRLRVVGTKKIFELARELAIRQALAEKTLWSACIAIEKSGIDRNRLPAKFKIRGAGWGHGVGMCQTGAAMMALRGYNFEQILRHYYTGVKLDKEY